MDVYINGDIWTNFSIQDLNPNGVVVHVSGGVFFCQSKEYVPKGGLWLPLITNHRYSLVNKKTTLEQSLPEKVKDIRACCNSKNIVWGQNLLIP